MTECELSIKWFLTKKISQWSLSLVFWGPGLKIKGKGNVFVLQVIKSYFLGSVWLPKIFCPVVSSNYWWRALLVEILGEVFYWLITVRENAPGVTSFIFFGVIYSWMSDKKYRLSSTKICIYFTFNFRRSVGFLGSYRLL